MKNREPKYTKQDLIDMQALPLERKIQISQTRILEWILKNGKDHVVVNFSGGKDSTVLLDLVRRIEPNIPAIFSNTGLEFPEVREFALSKPNVVVVKPELSFQKVLETIGYPLIGKDISVHIEASRRNDAGRSLKSKLRFLGRSTFIGRDGNEYKSWYDCEKWLPLLQLPIMISTKCCAIIKEKPINAYQKEHKLLPIIGTMASESRRRERGWINNGCNAFDISSPRSMPLAFWTEQDILNYIRAYDIEIPSVYGQIVPTQNSGVKSKNGVCLKCTGKQRTGCIFCGFGAHLEYRESGSNRFMKLAQTHPKLYDYCMRGGQWVDNPAYDSTLPVYDKDMPEWLNWNPKKVWTASSKGLGYKVMLDMVNSVYGKDCIPYC